ncbi:MAG TPA: RNA-binding protein [Nitrososphaerales archaeon]|nr:RNA-binding protein [Nitrososphaerales archaeon]
MPKDDLKLSLKDVESHLSDQLERRETLLRESRDVISSCSRAIISVHNGRGAEAVGELRAAKAKLESLRKSGGGPLSRYLISPETEYVEASAVLALAKGHPVPTRASLGASPEAYLLGLLDTVGELKRLVLDSIMKGNASTADRHFRSMEVLYSSCSPLAVYDHVANGARRKIDVARMLVEDTRGLMTEELRRESLSSSMRRLERRLDKRSRV